MIVFLLIKCLKKKRSLVIKASFDFIVFVQSFLKTMSSDRQRSWKQRTVWERMREIEAVTKLSPVSLCYGNISHGSKNLTYILLGGNDPATDPDFHRVRLWFVLNCLLWKRVWKIKKRHCFPVFAPVFSGTLLISRMWWRLNGCTRREICRPPGWGNGLDRLLLVGLPGFNKAMRLVLVWKGFYSARYVFCRDTLIGVVLKPYEVLQK